MQVTAGERGTALGRIGLTGPALDTFCEDVGASPDYVLDLFDRLIITIAAWKGGVGKTELAKELAWLLDGVLVDLDWDAGGATRAWGYRHETRTNAPLLDALERGRCPRPLSGKGVRADLIPSHPDFSVNQPASQDMAAALEKWSAELKRPLVIDTHPGGVPSTVGAASAAHVVVVPVNLETRALAATEQMANELQGGYPLYTGGKVPLVIRQAGLGLEARQALAEDTQASTVLDVCDLYLGAVFAQQVVDVNRQALESYRGHLEDARKAYKAGAVAQYDVIRAETAVKEQEKRLTESENTRALAVAALRTALALDASSEVRVEGALFEPSDMPPREKSEQAALNENRALRALGSKAEALDVAGKVEHAGAKPQVLAVGQRELLTGNTAQTDPEWFVGLQASVEVFDGGVRRAREDARRSESESARIEQQHARDQILLGIQSAYLDMDSARSSLEAATKAGELARESLRLATKRFDVGTGTSLEVLDANVSVSAADVGVCQALYQWDRACLRVHRFTNDILAVCQGAGNEKK